MTRSIPAALKAELESATPFTAECVVLQAFDGTRAHFTTLDTGFALDLGFGDGEELCSEGMTLSAITLATGLDASFAEMQGAMGGQMSRAALDGGKWDDAQAWVVQVSPSAPGFAPLLAGRVREVRAEDLRFVLEIRGHSDPLNQSLGKEFSPYCEYELGDSDCGFALPSVAATVTAVTDTLRFTVGYTGTFADDYFNLGRVDFLTGDLAGARSARIFDFTSGGANLGAVVLQEPLVVAPQVGDTLELRQGCPKTRGACVTFHGNADPFGGHPDLPGTEQVLRYTNPGSGG